MFCRKKNNHMDCVYCIVLTAIAVGTLAIFMTQTRKGKSITKKACHLADEAKELVKDELGM